MTSRACERPSAPSRCVSITFTSTLMWMCSISPRAGRYLCRSGRSDAKDLYGAMEIIAASVPIGAASITSYDLKLIATLGSAAPYRILLN